MLVIKIDSSSYESILKQVKAVKPSPEVYALLAKKGASSVIEISDIDNKALAILKQEALSCGAEVCLPCDISRFKKGKSAALLFATLRRLEILRDKLALQPFGLKELSVELEKIIKTIISPYKVFKCRDKIVKLDKPVVMGIINLDPNSFSGDGITDIDSAVRQAIDFQKAGAKILDIGAESSRPNSLPISAEIEIDRLMAALKKIRQNTDLPLSIDTYKYETAKAAADCGADIINDIFALKFGGADLAKLISKKKLGLILMHSKGKPHTMQNNPKYKNCTREVFEFLSNVCKKALDLGIEQDFISIDPGIGFAKTIEHNMELITNLGSFKSLGCLTVGVSRKNFIRKTAGQDKIYYVCANVLAARNGADIIRVHDTKDTVNAMRLI